MVEDSARQAVVEDADELPDDDVVEVVDVPELDVAVTILLLPQPRRVAAAAPPRLRRMSRRLCLGSSNFFMSRKA